MIVYLNTFHRSPRFATQLSNNTKRFLKNNFCTGIQWILVEYTLEVLEEMFMIRFSFFVSRYNSEMVDGRTHSMLKKYTYVCINVCSRWMDGWIDRWMDGTLTVISVCIFFNTIKNVF